MNKRSISGFKADESAEKIRRLEIDVQVREQELRRLSEFGGNPEQISEIKNEVASLSQALNMLAGPNMRAKSRKPFLA